jgi:DNA-binding transcriptional LysR family regulator
MYTPVQESGPLNTNWDDLRFFLTLVRTQKASAAARQLGVSHPTVTRRIKALEDAVGARLFDRLPDRFALTTAGERLLEDAQAMEEAAEAIGRHSASLGDTARGSVRLSADESIVAFIARQLPELRRDLQFIEFELAESHNLANLSRREADLLIREEVPNLASLVTRRLGRVAHAVYAGMDLEICETTDDVLRRMPWCGFDDAHTYMPGQGWTLELLGQARPTVRVNNWLTLLELVRKGMGLAVLPCHLGDGDPLIRRVGGVLENVTIDQWLLVHRDVRALARVRAVMDALIGLFRDKQALIEGRTGVEPAAVSVGHAA